MAATRRVQPSRKERSFGVVTVMILLALVAFTALGAGAADGSGAKSPPLKLKTSAGIFFVDGALLSDRFPPGCDDALNAYGCERSVRGYRVLTVWLKKGTGAKPGKLLNASKGAYIRASNGSRAKVFAGGIFASSPFVAFTPRATASGFKLHWPGNAPIALPKPVVQLGPA